MQELSYYFIGVLYYVKCRKQEAEMMVKGNSEVAFLYLLHETVCHPEGRIQIVGVQQGAQESL